MDRFWERFVVRVNETSGVSLDGVLEIIASCRNGEIRTEVEKYKGETLIYCESPVYGTAEVVFKLRSKAIHYDYTAIGNTYGAFNFIDLSDD